MIPNEITRRTRLPLKFFRRCHATICIPIASVHQDVMAMPRDLRLRSTESDRLQPAGNACIQANMLLRIHGSSLRMNYQRLSQVYVFQNFLYPTSIEVILRAVFDVGDVHPIQWRLRSSAIIRACEYISYCASLPAQELPRESTNTLKNSFTYVMILI